MYRLILHQNLQRSYNVLFYQIKPVCEIKLTIKAFPFQVPAQAQIVASKYNLLNGGNVRHKSDGVTGHVIGIDLGATKMIYY